MNELVLKLKNLSIKYQGLLYILSLLFLGYFFFFKGLGDYRLIDIDETRYVSISKSMLTNGNYITPYLNFEPFLEKPPLYYWLNVLSYHIFGEINNFTSRFFNSLFALLGVIGTYFFTSYIIKSKITGFLSSLVLMSAFWYALFSRIAILDMGFSVLSILTFYFGASILFTEKEWQKKMLWYLTCLFMGLAVLQKGLIGVIVPIVPILLIFIVFKRLKEIIKPSYLIPGAIIFILVCFPWHYFVYGENGYVWFREYILKHHFARFINSSMDIGRKHSFLYYVPVILGGLLPWSLYTISAFIKGGRYSVNTYKSTKSIKPLLSYDTRDRALILVSIIHFFTVFLFFSISSTKLPTYILTVFPSLSIVTGYFLSGYLIEDKNKKYVEISSLITFLVFFGAGIFGTYWYISGNINVGLSLYVSYIVFSVFGFIFLYFKNKIWILGMVLAFSLSLFGVHQAQAFNYITSFGQNELEDYAKIAADDKNENDFVMYGFSRKYCVLNIYDKKPVIYMPENTIEDNIKLLKGANVYIVIRNKKNPDLSVLKGIELVKRGEKYTLYKKPAQKE